MNKTYSHTCIKCTTLYRSTDEDAYLCDSCNENRLAIAKEIDAKFKTTGKKVDSKLQSLENLAKARGKFNERMEGGILVSSMTVTTNDLML